MIDILKLNEYAILILAYMNNYIAKNNDSISVLEIVQAINLKREIVIDTLLELKVNNYIHQTIQSDTIGVFWNNNNARYTIKLDCIEKIEMFLYYDEESKEVKIKGKYVWYAVYGTGILLEKFMHYIKGGICRFNHTEYEGCKDTSEPIASRQIVIPYKAYIGGSSPLWQYKGTMFLDTRQYGETKARMYLIKYEQYEEIRTQIGRGREKYDKEIDLGEYIGVPIKSVTSKVNKIPNEASKKYRELMEYGLKELYLDHKEDENINNYIESIFGYEVILNMDSRCIETIWKTEVKNIMDIAAKVGEHFVQDIDNKYKKVITTITLTKHNPTVVATRLALAKGRCERCGKMSPYYQKHGDVDFLEIYYIDQVMQNRDRVENTMALCPNCKKEIEMGIQ